MDQIGYLPKDFDPKIHGSYHPGRYYGKLDTPIEKVKLGELPQWIKRRQLSNPLAYTGAIGRFGWRWWSKWGMPRKLTLVPFLQCGVMIAAARYWQDRKEHRNHRWAKYH